MGLADCPNISAAKELICNLKYKELSLFLDYVKDLTRETFYKEYKVVRFMNEHGNNRCVREPFENKYPKLHLNWHGDPCTVGEFSAIIPIKDYSEELELDIITEFDTM